MKKMMTGLVVSMALVLSMGLSVFALGASGGEVTKSFRLTRESKVNGQVLKEGDYSVKFMDDKEGELVVMKGKKEVAKASYKFVELKSLPIDNTVAYSQNGDGTLHVKRLEFKGSKTALVFE